MGGSTNELSTAWVSTACGSSVASCAVSDGTVGLGAMVPAVNFQALSKTEFHENDVAGEISPALASNGSVVWASSVGGPSVISAAGCANRAGSETTGEPKVSGAAADTLDSNC